MSDDSADRRMSRLSSGPRSWLRRSAITTTVLLAAAGLVSPIAAAAGDAPQPIGPAPVAPAGAVRVADPAADTALHLDVELAPRDSAALNDFVAAVADPKSPRYRQYLAKGQFASTFGPAADTIKAVSAGLSAAGLRPGPVSADGLSIPVTTTIADAQRALGTSFAGYRLADGRTAYANLAAPQLRGSIAKLVTGVVGLTDVPRLAPHHTQPHGVVAAPTGSAVRPNALSPQSRTPQLCGGVQQGLAGNGLIDGQNYWEPGSLADSSVYNIGQLYSGYGNTGSGVTVGIFELEQYNPKDIAAYQSCFGTNVPVSNVLVDGGPATAPTSTNNVGIESALDIELVAGVAPGSSITVYQGPDASAATSQQVLDTYRRMVTDDTAQVLSTSWGLCEPYAGAAYMSAESAIFQQAAAQGQTVLAASGDTGSTSCYPNGGPNQSVLAVDDPAGQPYVTGVGGTRMTGHTAPLTLTTWNTPNQAAAGSPSNGAASGGGVSSTESLSGNGNYQSGATGPGYTNACNAAAGATCRQVPDVAAVADPATGYLIAYGQDSTGGQFWGVIGGTSGAAPVWAAIAALADSSTACAANGPIGFANPALYQNQGALVDVTTGNNVVGGTGYTGNLYQAGTGYDMTTGLGSPKAPELVEALCGAKTAAPGGSFEAMTPTRVLDTRTTNSPVRDHSQLSVQLTGANGVPATGVTAVVLNVTATNPTASSFLTVWADGVSRPLSSNVNFSPGQTIPNLVTVPVGADGKVDIYNLNGTVDVIADLFGYYTTDTTATHSLLQPVTPVRMLDTRDGTGTGGKIAPVGDHSTLGLQLSGVNGVPAGGVTAVVLNVTVTNPTAGSFLTVWPDGVAQPTSSNLNFTPGLTIPNLVTVPVGADGKVDIYNLNGTVDVIADLFGYYTNTGSGLKFHASTPHRLLDTRNGQGVAPGQPAPVGQNGTLALPLTDTNGTGNAGPLGTSGGLMLNVTVAEPTQSSFVTVYPSGVTRPLASNLNFTPGAVIPNAVLTPVNGNAVDFYNLNGTVQLIVDVFGYFANS